MIKRLIAVALVCITMSAVFCFPTQAKTFKKNGSYYCYLNTKDDKNEQFDSFAKKLVFKKKSFTTYGTMHYTKPGDVYSSKIYKVAKRTYKISPKCKFYKYTPPKNQEIGKYKKTKISYKKLKKLCLPLNKGYTSQEMIGWVIKKGVVKEMSFTASRK